MESGLKETVLNQTGTSYLHRSPVSRKTVLNQPGTSYVHRSPVSRKMVLTQLGTGKRKSWSGTVMAVSLAAKKTRKTTIT